VPVWGKISPAIGPQAQKQGIGELALKCLGHFEIERKICHGKIHLPGRTAALKERGNNMMTIEERLEPDSLLKRSVIFQAAEQR